MLAERLPAMTYNDLLSSIFAQMPREVFAANPEAAIGFIKKMANFCYAENGDKKGAVFFALRFVAEVGLPFESSFDALFGRGQFKEFAADLHAKLVAKVAAK